VKKHEILTILKSNAPAMLGVDDYDCGYEDGYARAIEVIAQLEEGHTDA
jgi:hypothetical protein